MRLLADENVPRETVLALRADGHDVTSASELSAGAPDETHVANAIAENRVIVTFDLDFGQIAATADPKPVAGVVLLRLVPQDPEEVTTIPRPHFNRADLGWRGYLSIVERGHLRQRPL
jgi:predicted nuclease of predicted toxin-antitoxin system